ncbi:MAG: hypothetical protein AAGA48_13340 [Myxococcota bacterium]
MTALLVALLGCRSEVCTTTPTTLPIARGTDDEVQLLNDVWQTFSEAVAPAELCLTRTEVWSVKEWRVEGRYRSVRRNIWVGRDDPEPMATALRHELCHAFDQQVLEGRPPSDAFDIDVRLAGAHPGKLPAREAFAWACSLEPTLIPAYHAASCDPDLGSEPFSHLATQVYSGLEPAPEFRLPRLEIADPTLMAREAIVSIEPFAQVENTIGVFLDFDDATSAGELTWIDLATGRLRPQPPEANVQLLIFAPAGALPPTGSLALPFYTAMSNTTEVALVETALLSGYVQRALLRRDGERWGASPDACGIPLDGRTSFFLLDRGRHLTSLSALDDNRLVVVGWDGVLTEG